MLYNSAALQYRPVSAQGQGACQGWGGDQLLFSEEGFSFARRTTSGDDYATVRRPELCTSDSEGAFLTCIFYHHERDHREPAVGPGYTQRKLVLACKDLPTYERCRLQGKQALLPGGAACPWGSRLLGDSRGLPMRRPSSGLCRF